MNTLNEQLKSSLFFSFLDKYFGYILRFISTIIVARLLTPEEIGLFSVAFVVISIGHVLRDFGVAQYLIKEADLTEEKIRAAFATMFIIAWSMWVILFWGKQYFADFYHEPRLSEALQVLTIIFLLAPFGSVRIALLRRNMQFQSLAKINVFSYITLFTVTLALCYLKFSYMALVWGQLAGVVATNIGCVLVCGKRYWYFPSLKGTREVIHFGVHITLANIVENTSDGAPDLLIGRLLSLHSVGLFSRAQGCVNLFKLFVTSSVWPVILPYFSIKNRSGEALLPDYLKAIEIYTAFAWPFFMALMILSEPVVIVLYGSQWIDSIILVKLLCMAAFFEASFPFRNALYISLGQAKQNFNLQLVVSTLRVSAILIGCFYGLVYAAIGYTLAEVLSQWVIYRSLKNLISMRLTHWLTKVWISLVATILTAMACMVVLKVNTYFSMPYWSILMIAFCACLSVWIATLFILQHPLKRFILGVLKQTSIRLTGEKSV